jgi:hypothetical protein
MNAKEPSGKPKPRIPGWAWLFAAACIIIPVIALGGAIPGAIGGGGAFGCVAVARDPSKSVGARIAVCLVITGICWGLFIALLVAAGVMQR